MTVIQPDDDYYVEILQRQRTEDLVDLFQLIHIQFQFAAYIAAVSSAWWRVCAGWARMVMVAPP